MADPNEEIRFTATSRALGEEDTIRLVSVGVDIGSATSHIIFSRLELERIDNRYVTTSREVLRESEILLTPYIDETRIDGDALGRFIDRQYELSGVQREDVDTGALILTGVALLRENARAIGELFALEAGRFVSVSAGDNLEATMAAHGSGAAQLSEKGGKTVLNVDVGGGTTKLGLCQDGRVKELAAFDVGARLMVVDENGTIIRMEEPGRRIARAIGLNLDLGGKATVEDRRKLAAYMAEKLVEIISLKGLSEGARALMRTPNVSASKIDTYTFSGGVSEFIYGREKNNFGDLGVFLGEEIRQRIEKLGMPVVTPQAGIRATVIGASQYTVQVSGSTIYISPIEVVPVRNIPVVMPDTELEGEIISRTQIEGALQQALVRFDLQDADYPVALALRWQGSATFNRINDFCHGIMAGMQRILDKGHPLVLVYDGDVGGLLGIHLKHEMHISNSLISIDGIELKEFDYIDVGAIIPTSGAVPVVIKSLVFPASMKK